MNTVVLCYETIISEKNRYDLWMYRKKHSLYSFFEMFILKLIPCFRFNCEKWHEQNHIFLPTNGIFELIYFHHISTYVAKTELKLTNWLFVRIIRSEQTTCTSKQRESENSNKHFRVSDSKKVFFGMCKREIHVICHEIKKPKCKNTFIQTNNNYAGIEYVLL